MLKGSAAVPKDAWFRHDWGSVVALTIDGKKVTRGEEVEVGRLPEGAVFSADGSRLYVGNYIDSTVSILKLEGGRISDTGRVPDATRSPGRDARQPSLAAGRGHGILPGRAPPVARRGYLLSAFDHFHPRGPAHSFCLIGREFRLNKSTDAD